MLIMADFISIAHTKHKGHNERESGKGSCCPRNVIKDNANELKLNGRKKMEIEM